VRQSVDLRVSTAENSTRLVRLTDGPGPGWALMLVKADTDVGLVVDEVIGRRDLVVEPLPAPLSNLREYSGAAVLDDGTIALVLDALYITRPAELRKGISAPSGGSCPSAPRRSPDPPPSLS